MMVSGPAPEARAASTKSRLRTPVVTLSATRTIGGMNTIVSDRIAVEDAGAERARDGDREQHRREGVEHVDGAHDRLVDDAAHDSPAITPSVVADQRRRATTGVTPMNSDSRPP